MVFRQMRLDAGAASRSVFALLMLMALCASALAQSWNARELLSKTQSERVRLLSKGHTAEVVERAWVERVVAATDRLAGVYGLATPAIWLKKEDQPNAYVTTDKDGHHLMVLNTEMLKLVGDDEHMTAAVIGHELGHLKGKHLEDGATRGGFVTLLGVLAGAALDLYAAHNGVDTQAGGTKLGMLGGALVNAKFDRDQEREADKLGLEAMARAGYDPHAAARLWRRMNEASKGGEGSWLSTHPSGHEREETLRVAAASLSVSNPVATAAAAAGVTAPASLAPVAVTDPFPPEGKTSLALTVDEQVSAEAGGAYRRGVELQRIERYEEAVAEYRKVEETDERAMAQLADAYLFGRGVQKDHQRALEYYQRAADRGFTPAIAQLAQAALSGTGRARDDEEARRLFSIAHQRGHARATAWLSMLYTGGNGGPRDVTQGRQLAQLAASRGDALGKALYGVAVRDGLGGNADPATGFSLLKEAALDSSAHNYGLYQLAWSYEKGLGTTEDAQEAIRLYRAALAKGARPARERLTALGVAP